MALADAERGNETTDETSYYEHWLTALETLAAQLGLADAHSMAARKADWALAFERTPHGQPVELSPP